MMQRVETERAGRRARRGAVMVAALAMLTVAAGCPGNGDNNNDGGGGRDGSASALTDPEIAMVLRRANDGEIQQGQLALMRATSPAVLSFAQLMVTDHTAANARQMALYMNRGITPADSDLSRQLVKEATDGLDMLRGVTDNPGNTSDGGAQDLGGTDGGTGGPDGGLGSAFDRAYMDVQVTMHTRVLMLIDSALLPAARDAALRAELDTTRAAVQGHLNDARDLRARLGS